MKMHTPWFKCWALLALWAALPGPAQAATQVLATVGNLQVTADDLKSAMASSPFSTQETAMDESDQASLRGDMLRRLVAARLLTLEAQRLGLDKTQSFLRDVEAFRRSLLYRYYMDKLRERVVIPEAALSAMKKQFKADADGLAAAKSAYTTEQFRALRLATLQNLQQQDHLKLYEERINASTRADTVLMESNSFQIKYGDIVNRKEHPALPNPEWVKEQLYKRGELLLIANAADKEKVDVTSRVKQYQNERLPDVMLERKTREWIPNEKILRNWFEHHPEVSNVPERRHVGQLVLATRQEAEAMRERILKGESLFTLAGKYSMDPDGRSQNGDMGWLVAGRGMPELDQALSRLEDNKVSEVIQTSAGYHLLTIVERKPGEKKPYTEVQERIRQIIINEKLRPYLGELERRYKVTWAVMQGRADKAAEPAKAAAP